MSQSCGAKLRYQCRHWQVWSCFECNVSRVPRAVESKVTEWVRFQFTEELNGSLVSIPTLFCNSSQLPVIIQWQVNIPYSVGINVYTIMVTLNVWILEAKGIIWCSIAPRAASFIGTVPSTRSIHAGDFCFANIPFHKKIWWLVGWNYLSNVPIHVLSLHNNVSISCMYLCNCIILCDMC